MFHKLVGYSWWRHLQNSWHSMLNVSWIGFIKSLTFYHYTEYSDTILDLIIVKCYPIYLSQLFLHIWERAYLRKSTDWLS